MRPTFFLDLGRPVSAIIRKDHPHAFKRGDAICLSKAYETPWGKLPAGLGGTVTDVDDDEGIVEIIMDGANPALYLWGNKLILVPFETEDLAEAIVCRRQSYAMKPRPRYLQLATAATVAFGLGWMLDPPFHFHMRHAAAAMVAPCGPIAAVQLLPTMEVPQCNKSSPAC